MQPIPDLSFQRRLTVGFTVLYALMVAALFSIGGALFLAPETTFSEDVREILIFLMGLIGPLVGMLTGSLKDQLQFHYGSSVGSKTKDGPRAA